MPDISWAFEPNQLQFSHDPARARALLDEAGYRDPDGDGPEPRLRLSLKVSTNEFYRLQAAVIQQNLREVGIELDVRSYEFATLYADVVRGNFQLVTLQFVGVSDPDILRRVFHSKQMPPVGFNRGFYSNPEVDRLIDEASKTLDEDARGRFYREVQKLVAEDVPYISLWYKTNYAVAPAGAHRHPPHPARRVHVPEGCGEAAADQGSINCGWRAGLQARLPAVGAKARLKPRPTTVPMPRNLTRCPSIRLPAEFRPSTSWRSGAEPIVKGCRV